MARPRTSLKKRAWEVLDLAKPRDRASALFDWFIMSLIILNVLAVIVGTVRVVAERFGAILDGFEIFSVAVFSAEYVMRFWSCTAVPEYRDPVLGRLRYAVTPMAVIDLLAVLPFYLTFTAVDLRFLRALRLFRLLRLAKLVRYTAALGLIQRVLRAKREELVVTSGALALLLVIASCLMYFVEYGAQPKVFSSIPAAMWWAIVTLTTVGYGDIYPVTALGKVVGAVIAILGIGLFALPTGILGAGFVEDIQQRRGKRRCPHCGKEIA